MYQRFHSGLAATARCLNVDIVPITQEWARIYESRRKTRGKQDAVKFCKELNTVAERYALRQKIEPIPWTKSSSDNYPSILNFAKANLRSQDTRLVVLTLSVFRSVEVLRLPISKDISTVTQPCSCDTELVKDIIAFIPRWVKRFQPLNLSRMKYHFTLKNGPNGHALKTSDMDISAVMADRQLYEAIHKVEEILRDVSPMKDIKEKYPNAIHSKITQFPEKSGKTRTIAIIDYYSQRCLKPLHDGLMAFLGKLVSDGTYSHQNVGKFVQQKTKEKSFVACADLTAATDRFPAVIQEALLHELLQDRDLSNALWTLLAKRTFHIAWSDEEVTYQCGQPMGAHASWPLFATAHHLIVEYCAETNAKANVKEQYRIIGDDVVITREEIYKAYQSVMARLGLTINRGKTVISAKGSEFSGAEVAKQLYLNGINITPLTPGFIRNIKKPHMFNTCLGVLLDRYEFIRPETPSMLIETMFRRTLRPLVWLLASNPMNGNIKPFNKGYDELCPWEPDLTDEYRDRFNKELITRFLDLAYEYSDMSLDQTLGDIDPLNFDWDSLSDIHTWGSPWRDSTSPEPQCYANIRISIERQLTQMINELGGISTGEPIENLVARFDFVPNPQLPYLDRRELRQRRTASILESLLKSKDDRIFVQLEW